jgi:hypothetical protein
MIIQNTVHSHRHGNESRCVVRPVGINQVYLLFFVFLWGVWGCAPEPSATCLSDWNTGAPAGADYKRVRSYGVGSELRERLRIPKNATHFVFAYWLEPWTIDDAFDKLDQLKQNSCQRD